MYRKVDIIKQSQNKVRTGFDFFLLNLFFEAKRWIHANPTLYEKSKLYRKYFVKEGIEGQLDDFFKMITSKSSKFTILKGKRGSGKTSFLNYCLNERTRDLNSKPYNLTWVRIDCTKIFKNELEFNSSLNFEKYLYGQLLFVYFRYMGKDGTCRTRIVPHNKDNDPDFSCSEDEVENIREVESYDSVFAKVELKKKIKDNIELEKEYEIAQNMSCDAPHYNNTTHGKPFDCFNLGKKLFSLVSHQLILIIDGIDNISYDSKLKDDVWRDLEIFLKSMQNQPIFKIVLSLRDENHKYFANKLPSLLKKDIEAHGINNHIINEIQTVPFKKIMKRFNQKILDEELETYTAEHYHRFLVQLTKLYKNYLIDLDTGINDNKTIEDFLKLNIEKIQNTKELENQLNREIFTINRKFIEYLNKCGKKVLDGIEKAVAFKLSEENKEDVSAFNLPKKIEKQPIKHYFIFADNYEYAIKESFSKMGIESPPSILKDFFNGDMREMIILSYKSYISYVLLMKKTYKYNDPDSLEKHIKQKFLNVMHPIFINGNRFAICRSDVMFHPPYRNINVINLFNVVDVSQRFVSPLYLFYMLDYMKTSKTVDAVIEKLKLYEHRDYVERCINNYLEFGYINADETDDKLSYVLSAKGKHILNYSLNDMVTLHTYLFGALMDERLHKFIEKQTTTEFKSYNIFNESKFPSTMLINLSILYYMLYIERGNLNAIGILSKDFDIEFITPKVRLAFREYFKSNNYLYNNLKSLFFNVQDIITPKGDIYKNTLLHQNISQFVREKILDYSDYIELFTNVQTRVVLMKELSKEERYLFLSRYLGVSDSGSLLDDTAYHEFVFETASDLKREERKKELLGINPQQYIDSLKEKLKSLGLD